jgi:site-specific recombinase XerD
MQGKIFDKLTKRNKTGYYKKYLLVSSHICRRSFATNLTLMGFPTQVIMRITGHRTESAFQTYLKMSPLENANIIIRDWESRLKIGS